MQTDLARILSVAGQHGLFHYVAQARSGAIGESLETKQRKVFSTSSRISTLADIAIYTSEGEMKLDEVFLALRKVLGDAEAPSAKEASDAELTALFRKAIPKAISAHAIAGLCAGIIAHFSYLLVSLI